MNAGSTTRQAVISTILLLAVIVQMVLPISAQQKRRGAANVKVKNDATGKTEDVKLYKASYALVIGESDYTNGWQKLEGVKGDVKAVSDALAANGFEVTKVVNAKKSELVAAIEKFISDYGYDFENRLLIYYAGHGHTQKSGAGFEQGFIVPIDAPTPTANNESAFKRMAVSMDTIERYAQEIDAKHALFVFDSCFSGALITKTRSSIPPIITTKTTLPVRQFITAGSDDQEVPDVSEFRKQFVLGLSGEADRNLDNFVTASELADFLQDKVSRYTRNAQTPQYGKIRDARLDKGDFVFPLPPRGDEKSVKNVSTGKPTATKPQTTEEPNFGTATSAAEVERQAFVGIQNSNDAEEIRAVLEEYPNSKYAATARLRLDKLVWESVKSSRDKSKIQSYLTEFPSGQFAGLARIELRKLNAATVATTTTTGNNENSGTPAKGSIRKNSIGMEMVYIPSGEFMMGSSEEEVEQAWNECKKVSSDCPRENFTPEMPKNKVTIANGFYMGKYEVTQEEYEKVTGNNPSNSKNCPRCPVERVSWDDAQEFVKKMNAKNDGFFYSLPSEAEWEYAARAGTTTVFSFGDSASSSQANFNGNYPYGGAVKGQFLKKTTPVGSYQANKFGLHDMHGNVVEWVADIYNTSYDGLSVDGSVNKSVGDLSKRVLRGGSWNYAGIIARSATRYPDARAARGKGYGFRVVARLSAS